MKLRRLKVLAAKELKVLKIMVAIGILFLKSGKILKIQRESKMYSPKKNEMNLMN